MNDLLWLFFDLRTMADALMLEEGCAGKHGGEGFNLSYEVLAYARPSTTPRRYRAGYSLLAGTNTPVPERPRFPAAPLSCHVFAARQRATYRGVGSLEEHRKARERKRRAECDAPREGVGSCVSSECGA